MKRKFTFVVGVVSYDRVCWLEEEQNCEYYNRKTQEIEMETHEGRKVQLSRHALSPLLPSAYRSRDLAHHGSWASNCQTAFPPGKRKDSIGNIVFPQPNGQNA
jgi:hypothetical protein